jgi:hypothetical protein
VTGELPPLLPLMRVERGHPDGDELAALAVVLLARAASAARQGTGGRGRPAAPAPRRNRSGQRDHYRSPASWLR